MRRALALLCLVWACAASPASKSDLLGLEELDDCVTLCGLRVLTHKGTCKTVQATEDRLLLALADSVPAITPAQMCAAEKGWIVVPHGYNNDDKKYCDGNGWLQGLDCVIGYTFKDLQMVETANEDWAHNALAHELMHVASLYRWHKTGHCQWKEMGIKAAIKAVTGEEDLTPGCSLPDGGQP